MNFNLNVVEEFPEFTKWLEWKIVSAGTLCSFEKRLVNAIRLSKSDKKLDSKQVVELEEPEKLWFEEHADLIENLKEWRRNRFTQLPATATYPILNRFLRQWMELSVPVETCNRMHFPAALCRTFHSRLNTLHPTFANEFSSRYDQNFLLHTKNLSSRYSFLEGVLKKSLVERQRLLGSSLVTLHEIVGYLETNPAVYYHGMVHNILLPSLPTTVFEDLVRNGIYPRKAFSPTEWMKEASKNKIGFLVESSAFE